MDSPDELSGKLRSWPRGFVADLRVVVWQTLAACAELFRAAGAVLAWEDREEPWLIVARLSDHGLDWREEDAAEFAPVVAPALSEAPFLLQGSEVVRSSGLTTNASAIHPRMWERLGARTVIVIPVRGETTEGYIFVLDPGNRDRTMLVLSEMIGRLVEERMDAVAQYRTVQRDAVAEERLRVARDLHDGLLQSFTGVVLQLETIHDILEREPDRARRMLTEAQGIIMSDQRELRAFVEELRPRRRGMEAAFDFPARLEDLRSRFRQQWGIELLVDAAGVDPNISKHLGQETYRLIQEAVTNSAKHGGASQVDVRLRTDDSRIRIEVSDNGSGFAFHGRMSLDAIREKGIGPAVLAERVASLNGDLSVESTDHGARLEISFPLGWSGA
jgi:signal transduction histidine kinase